MAIGDLISSPERIVEAVGAGVSLGVILLPMIICSWFCCARKVEMHPLRRKFIAFWKIALLTNGLMHLWLLWSIADTERPAGSGRFVNWTRWAFYMISYGLCFTGMLNIFQLQIKKATHFILAFPLLIVFFTALTNAFAATSQARNMLFGVGGAFGAIFCILLFIYDERNRLDCIGLFVKTCVVAAVAVNMAIFVVGHANKQDIVRWQESLAFLIVEFFIFVFVSYIMKHNFVSSTDYLKLAGNTADSALAALSSPVAVAAGGAAMMAEGAAQVVNPYYQ